MRCYGEFYKYKTFYFFSALIRQNFFISGSVLELRTKCDIAEYSVEKTSSPREISIFGPRARRARGNFNF